MAPVSHCINQRLFDCKEQKSTPTSSDNTVGYGKDMEHFSQDSIKGSVSVPGWCKHGNWLRPKVALAASAPSFSFFFLLHPPPHRADFLFALSLLFPYNLSLSWQYLWFLLYSSFPMQNSTLLHHSLERKSSQFMSIN